MSLQSALSTNLIQHHQFLEGHSPHFLRQIFAQHPQRFEQFQLQAGDWLIDYSRNLIVPETMKLLLDWASAMGLSEKRQALFNPELFNHTEQRAVLHTALRSRTTPHLEIRSKVEKVLSQMEKFVLQVHGGEFRGSTGLPIKNIVNIGIGGSDLGPLMVCEALWSYRSPEIHSLFLSNLDPFHAARTLSTLNPAETLFIVASKTFTTLETMTNAQVAKQWLQTHLGEKFKPNQHFVAVSTNAEAVLEFGIDLKHMFEFWDWVGGRFSLSSAIGLPIMLAIGPKAFYQFLRGMELMDEHFHKAPLLANAPVILGCIGAWYRQYYRFPTHAIVPYAEALRSFVPYLQQTDMESNGKTVTRQGTVLDRSNPTGPIIWGGVGTNAQHAFFQHLHQSPEITPVDFILFAQSCEGQFGPPSLIQKQQDQLNANALAQVKALAFGKNRAEVLASSPKTPLELIPYKIFSGDRPATVLACPKLTPSTLGQLIALYEHKVFVQGVLWDINSFDQWGVEFGKELAKKLTPLFEDPQKIQHEQPEPKEDQATLGLLRYLTTHANPKSGEQNP